MDENERDEDRLTPEHAIMMIRGLDGKMYTPEDLPPDQAAEVLRGIAQQQRAEVVDTINTMRTVITDLIQLLAGAMKRNDAADTMVIGQALSHIGTYLQVMGWMPFEVFRAQVTAGLSFALGELGPDEARSQAVDSWREFAPEGTLDENGYFNASGFKLPQDSQQGLRDLFGKLFGGDAQA